MQLKPLKKRLNKNKLERRYEKHLARRAGTQKTQEKDIMRTRMIIDKNF